MATLLERTTTHEPPLATHPNGSNLSPPTGTPQVVSPPHGWPRRAKVVVAVLSITTIAGVAGTVIGLTRDDRSDEVTQLESDVAALESDVDGLEGERDAALADAARLTDEIAALDADLADLAQQLEAAEEGAATNARQVSALEATVGDLESTLAAVTAERDDAFGVIDQLETDLINGVVADRHGIAVAVPYPSSESIHPIAVLGEGVATTVASELPAGWTSDSVFDVELVAHIGDSTQTVIEVCPYNGPDITRYRYSTDVSLYSATSGERIASETLRGDDPRQCQQTEPWSLTELHGTEVTSDQIISWLEQFVSTS